MSGFQIDDGFSDSTQGSAVDQALGALYQRAYYLNPSKSGTLDDWIRFNAAIVENAYQRPVVLRSGTYRCKSPGVIASGSHVILEPGVTIQSSLVAGAGGFVNFVFGMLITNNNVSQASTLSATPTIGSKILKAHASYPVGSWVYIRSIGVQVFVATQYQIRAVVDNHDGTFDLTTDIPILFSFAPGDSIYLYTQNRDVVIDGNFGKILGAGDRCYEFEGLFNGRISGLQIIGSSASHFVDCGSIDIGSRQVVVQQCYADSPGSSNGHMVESSQDVIVKDCVANNLGIGFDVHDSIDIVLDHDDAGVCTNAGLIFDSNLLGTQGCKSCIVRGGTYNGGANVGINVALGTAISLVGGVQARYNASVDFQGNANTETFADQSVDLGTVLLNASAKLTGQTMGVGAPGGVVTRSVGATYARRDGGAGTSLYVKEAGVDANGWVAK